MLCSHYVAQAQQLHFQVKTPTTRRLEQPLSGNRTETKNPQLHFFSLNNHCNRTETRKKTRKPSIALLLSQQTLVPPYHHATHTWRIASKKGCTKIVARARGFEIFVDCGLVVLVMRHGGSKFSRISALPAAVRPGP